MLLIRTSYFGFATTIALLASLPACSATSRTPTSSVSSSIAADTVPTPLDPSASDADIDKVPLNTNVPIPKGMNLQDLRHGITPLSSVGQSDHEDAGIGFQGAGRYTSLFAIHAIHPDLQLPYLASQTGTEFLYAPTTKDGCLENVTVYVNGGSGTQVQFSVFDWCNAITFIANVTVDAQFMDQYVRDLGFDDRGGRRHDGMTGVAEGDFGSFDRRGTRFGTSVYVTQIYTHDMKPHPGSIWYSLIFNFRTHRWNAVASVEQQPASPDYNGWSIFETFFLPGPCPVLPPIGATGVSLYDTVARSWRLLTPQLPDISTSSIAGPPGSCFVGNATGPATYKARIVPDYSWEVASER